MFGFFQLSGWRPNDGREHERRVYEWFARYADALRPISIDPDTLLGWPRRVGRALAIAAEAQIGLGRLWDCAEVAQPEPERSAYLETQERRFHERFERTVIRAAIAWQDHDEGRSCPVHVHALADRGREARETASVSPRDGERAYRDAANKQGAPLWRRGEKLILHNGDFGSAEDRETIEALRRDLALAHELIKSALAEAGDDRQPTPPAAIDTTSKFDPPPEGVEIHSFNPDMVAFYRKKAIEMNEAIGDLEKRALVTLNRQDLGEIRERIDHYRNQIIL